MRSKKTWLLVFGLLAASSCAKVQPAQNLPVLPDSWHTLPEDSPTRSERGQDPAALASGLDSILASTQEAVDQALPQNREVSSFSLSQGPGWHVGAVVTDLSVSLQGVLGLLMKGTPSVTLIWKPKPSVAVSALKQDDGELSEQDKAISINEFASPAELERDMEPVVQAGLASGQIQDESGFRGNLKQLVQEFQELALQLATRSPAEWWPSRFRADITVDGSGKLSNGVAVGADLRFRLEWHRMMRKAADGPVVQASALEASPPARDFAQLVSVLAEEVAASADSFKGAQGFRAQSFRVGVGMTAKKQFGVVKASAGWLGHLYFSRAPKKVKSPAVFTSVAPLASVASVDSIPMIEETPKAEHLSYASAHLVPSSRIGDSVMYRIRREDFRKGLKRAGQIAGFFTQQASKLKSFSWGIQELRTGFDLSVTGEHQLANVNGLVATEVSFINQGF